MSETCSQCYGPKATYSCGICQTPTCKKCTQFLSETHFSFMEQVPEELTRGTYCPQCFDLKVAPELKVYNEIMERAKNVHVFFKDQGKETRMFRRLERPVLVENCEDRAETIMRLAFFAARANYNGVTDVDIAYKKVYHGSYQKTMWSGKGIPVHVEHPERHLPRKD